MLQPDEVPTQLACQRVTAPSAALETSRAYLVSATPGNGRSGGSIGGGALGQLLIGEGHVEPAGGHVEGDLVAVADQSDRAAADRLGGHVAGHQAAGGPGEAPVGDQGDLLAEPLPHQRRGDGQHLAHAGAAGGTLVADHDHVARVDRAGRA